MFFSRYDGLFYFLAVLRHNFLDVAAFRIWVRAKWNVIFFERLRVGAVVKSQFLAHDFLLFWVNLFQTELHRVEHELRLLVFFLNLVLFLFCSSNLYVGLGEGESCEHRHVEVFGGIEHRRVTHRLAVDWLTDPWHLRLAPKWWFSGFYIGLEIVS